MNNAEHRATRIALREALEECETLARHNYPAWLKAVDRLAALRATVSHPTTLTRAIDQYLGQAKP